MPYKVTNIARGPRYFHSNAGTKTLDPGQSVEGIEFGEGMLDALRRRGDFVTEEMGKPLPSAANVVDFDAMTDDELRAHIETRDGKAPAANAKRETLLRRAKGEQVD